MVISAEVPQGAKPEEEACFLLLCQHEAPPDPPTYKDTLAPAPRHPSRTWGGRDSTQMAPSTMVSRAFIQEGTGRVRSVWQARCGGLEQLSFLQ